MNGCIDIRYNVTSNKIFSNDKYLIINPSYSDCSSSNVDRRSSHAILDSDDSHNFLPITTHYLNIHPCTTKHYIILPNNIVITTSHLTLLDLPWFTSVDKKITFVLIFKF